MVFLAVGLAVVGAGAVGFLGVLLVGCGGWVGMDVVGAGGAGEGFVWFWGGVGHCIEQEIFTVARCGRGGEGADHAPLGNQFGHEGSLAQPRGDGEGHVHGGLGAVGDPGASFGG